MLLDAAHNILGWPRPDQVLTPTGCGAKVYADQVKRKIGEALRRTFTDVQVETGILTADPNASTTEAPLAVVCQFPRGVPDEVLDEAQRLAWNFSRTALLVTLEPHRLVAWSCCQSPKDDLWRQRRVCELSGTDEEVAILTTEQRTVADLLHWVSLLTGHLRQQRPKQFRPEGRADSLLLQNLRDIRHKLLNDGMPERYCHDLLARIIFTQFLFHRKDADGRAFFDDRLLGSLAESKVLQRTYKNFAPILANENETYALFRWLDQKFNGDLFPGSVGQSDADRETAWQDEKDAVTKHRLGLLAEFVSGGLELANLQHSLWPLYSFDVIPLEFISSVYEEFLNEEKLRDKAYYTPAYLVDFVLDGILPWEGEEWDLKILDPACGSGIFLVKAFQRLINRWKTAHPGKDPTVRPLKKILSNNLVGIDKNPEAVRVACFSLYLAMADAIEPKEYLAEKVFPSLRGSRLLAQDFFDETTEGIRTHADAQTYDYIIGNAPWGDNSIKTSSRVGEAHKVNVAPVKSAPTKAEIWAKKYFWPVANHDLGPVFLGKAAKLVRSGGRVAMVQPAATLLYQRAGKAGELRRKLFTEFTVDEITNLTVIRREIFSGAVSPACVIIFGTTRPEPEQMLLYSVPKRYVGSPSQRVLLIEPQDINQISHAEAAGDPLVWTIFAAGGRRDWLLVRRLSFLPTLNSLDAAKQVMCRLGIIPGDQQQEFPSLRRKPYLGAASFPEEVFLTLNADTLELWEHPFAATTYATNPEVFKQPQMLIKQSFSATDGRYRAARVQSNDREWGAVCKKTYLSVRDLSSDGRHVKTTPIVYNSQFAAYFLNLTSSRALYNTELLSTEVKSLPLPPIPTGYVEPQSFAEIDALVEKALGLSEAEAILLEDFVNFTLPTLLRAKAGEGNRPTARREENTEEPQLAAYAQIFAQVVKGTFGSDRAVATTVFQESGSGRLPVRLVGIHLDWLNRPEMSVERFSNDVLHTRLSEFYLGVLAGSRRASQGEGLGFQRVAFFFHAHEEPQGRVRSLYIIKPDERRYWTRSLAMRDADQLTAAIFKAATRSSAL